MYIYILVDVHSKVTDDFCTFEIEKNMEFCS